jgi:hypothetical protein
MEKLILRGFINTMNHKFIEKISVKILRREKHFHTSSFGPILWCNDSSNYSIPMNFSKNVLHRSMSDSWPANLGKSLFGMWYPNYLVQLPYPPQRWPPCIGKNIYFDFWLMNSELILHAIKAILRQIATMEYLRASCSQYTPNLF